MGSHVSGRFGFGQKQARAGFAFGQVVFLRGFLVSQMKIGAVLPLQVLEALEETTTGRDRARV